jgi:hypothetical protein
MPTRIATVVVQLRVHNFGSDHLLLAEHVATMFKHLLSRRVYETLYNTPGARVPHDDFGWDYLAPGGISKVKRVVISDA